MPKQTAHRCGDIYSTGSICFTNTDKKCLVWQQYLVGNFGFALHILLYWASLPSDPGAGKAGIHAELWFVPLLPCGDDGSLLLSFLFIDGAFFVTCHSLSPCFQEHSAAWIEISVIARSQQHILYFMQWRGCAGLWLQVWHSGPPECWFAWKPCSLASVASVVQDRD